MAASTLIRKSGKSELQDELVSSRLESNIVIVEDDTIARMMIKGFLEQAGYQSLHFAEDGGAGLELIRTVRPSLVILDVDMPVMNGYEVLKNLREDPDFANLPVIVETALDSPEERVAAFDNGATDLVAKPLNGTELTARIRIHLENSLFTKALEAYRDRVDRDLQAARNMQAQLNPPQDYLDHVSEKYSFSIETVYEPSLELGGDYLGLECISDNKFGFFIADFTGHGVSSALNTFRLQSVLAHLETMQFSVVGYLQKVNEMLCQILPRGQFATALCGIIDIAENTLTYAGAGSTPLYLRDNGTDRFILLEAPGLPLGISAKAQYEEVVRPFEKGAELFLCSDALLESPADDGTMLEEVGVTDLLSMVTAYDDTGKPLEELYRRFNKFAALPLSDDLTLCWLRRH